MTLIIGLKHNGKVYMGADSAGVADNHIVRRKDSKLFKLGDFLIGCTTSFRMIQIIQFSFKPPKFIDIRDVEDNANIGKDIFEYLCTDFIDALRDTFKDKGFGSFAGKEGDEGGTFLLAYRDRLFEIDSDFQVGENTDNYNAVGSGLYHAFGALHALTGKPNEIYKDTPKEVVEAALSASCQHCTTVSRPFYFENT